MNWNFWKFWQRKPKRDHYGIIIPKEEADDTVNVSGNFTGGPLQVKAYLARDNRRSRNKMHIYIDMHGLTLRICDKLGVDKNILTLSYKRIDALDCSHCRAAVARKRHSWLEQYRTGF